MTSNILILTTTGTRDEAQKIARALVEQQLAACVNILPQIHSIYRWQGKVDEADECLLLIKTVASNFERVRDTIRQLHSYDLPECLSLAIDNGSSEYLNWIADSVK